jgi:hypothetical protein
MISRIHRSKDPAMITIVDEITEMQSREVLVEDVHCAAKWANYSVSSQRDLPSITVIHETFGNLV